MTNQSVNEPSWRINQNKINEALLKSEALLQIVLNSEFESIPHGNRTEITNFAYFNFQNEMDC